MLGPTRRSCCRASDVAGWQRRARRRPRLRRAAPPSFRKEFDDDRIDADRLRAKIHLAVTLVDHEERTALQPLCVETLVLPRPADDDDAVSEAPLHISGVSERGAVRPMRDEDRIARRALDDAVDEVRRRVVAPPLEIVRVRDKQARGERERDRNAETRAKEVVTLEISDDDSRDADRREDCDYPVWRQEVSFGISFGVAQAERDAGRADEKQREGELPVGTEQQRESEQREDDRRETELVNCQAAEPLGCAVVIGGVEHGPKSAPDVARLSAGHVVQKLRGRRRMLVVPKRTAGR